MVIAKNNLQLAPGVSNGAWVTPLRVNHLCIKYIVKRSQTLLATFQVLNKTIGALMS